MVYLRQVGLFLAFLSVATLLVASDAILVFPVSSADPVSAISPDDLSLSGTLAGPIGVVDAETRRLRALLSRYLWESPQTRTIKTRFCRFCRLQSRDIRQDSPLRFPVHPSGTHVDTTLGFTSY